MLEVLEIINECSSPALSAILSTSKRLITFIQILGPLLLLVALVINFVKLMSNPEDKKLKKSLINSLIAAVLLFFIPMLINVTMKMLDDTFTVSACWNAIGDYSGEAKYIKTDEKGKNILGNPDDYEKGVKKSGSSSDGTAKKAGDVVWDSNDVTKISNLTSNQLIGILNAQGGNAKNFIPYASGIIAAEHKYSVNAFFLIGVEALESGWITSPISRNCNNLGGVCASSAHPSNGCGRNSNCSFAYFKSVNDFVDYHANMLHKNYLTPGGSYYHGKSPSAVVTNYCPGCSSWPGNVISIANGLFSKVSSVL